jgi:acyl-homoserine-lactone acylase
MLRRAFSTGLLIGFMCTAHAQSVDPVQTAESARWHREAAAVEIVRDSWGIAHVYGKTDADTVFGMVYAQAEDDFFRIEQNYLTNLGWLAQAEGEKAIWSDLRQRLFVDTDELKRQYQASPVWLKSLMDAWADGLNDYLATHPGTHPRVITRFEPWMTLAFTEGSIGGDIESVDLGELEAFYGGRRVARLQPPVQQEPEDHPGGSNGFAVAPARSANGHALLLINPHTSFYFRSELQMVSQEGLNVYGAVTWGQFFIYQGFNEHNGWMHTSYGGDAIDEFAEDVVKQPDGMHYRYGSEWRPLKTTQVTVPYRVDGKLASRSFTVYHSLHGPIVRAEKGRWIATKLLQTPVEALSQSYLRTKTLDYAGFYKTQEMRTDTSNNTVYADADGTIAYFHGNFIPRRNTRFDYTHPVDGADPATDWQGPHALKDTIMVVNPKTGWVQNTNNWPFSAAGADSPKREAYPRYMWTAGENPRGAHALEVLSGKNGFSLDSLIAAAYDSHLTGFDLLIPPLLKAYDRLPAPDPRRAALAGPIDALRTWDHRTGAASVPTALAIFWGNELISRKSAAAHAIEEPVFDFLVEKINDEDRLDALAAAVAKLSADFGRWQTPWGDINRFQRRTDDIVQPFDDAAPSLAIGMAPSRWGALASFDASKPQLTKKIYGSVGNSFVAVVEFGPKVHAKAVMSGGESGDPASPHFIDQAPIYSQGRFRDVLFYQPDVLAHAERRYHPGD